MNFSVKWERGAMRMVSSTCHTTLDYVFFDESWVRFEQHPSCRGISKSNIKLVDLKMIS